MRLLLAMTVAMVMMTFNVNAADLAGTWKGSMETQDGTKDVLITIQPGATLSGTVAIGGYDGVMENGKLDGDKFSFAVKMEPGVIECDGTTAGGEMKLNIKGTQGDKYALICRRQK